MESDFQHTRYHLRDNHHKQPNSGLTRYQSAPSSYFSSFLDAGDGVGDEFLFRPPSPETERIFQKFLESTEELTEPMEVKLEREEQAPLPPPPPIPQLQPEKHNSFQGFHQQQMQNQKQGEIPGMGFGAAATASAGMKRLPPQPPSAAAAADVSSLIRHSSSPAGLFNSINVENDYIPMRGSGDLGDSKAKIESLFASKPPPSPKIPDLRKQSSFGANDRRTLSGGFHLPETKNLDGVNRLSRLSHHLSLPKSLSEMSEIEKILQLSDSVPCKIRAKRGCATHPRSIAERVRRTKISERMKKLQDLVPNMDKQTNTADMLDLAVDHIKDLQERLRILQEDRARCTCSSVKK
ncbi:PREDICTED: transcription factor bHLH122 [Tarenaya hassleriana]|uniref:transcription factor bHLH122 n=1 Tax=Tarenaya hassleriana TaxID=28532 RepID=UPI00053C5301|nr:PREDICTED: transcription factor bHLH122 [Tarenaya hassleriana]XP_010536059.1 PREDICTED: transcription factor bHLH122 [Tarenaya hassleriana]